MGASMSQAYSHNARWEKRHNMANYKEIEDDDIGLAEEAEQEPTHQDTSNLTQLKQWIHENQHKLASVMQESSTDQLDMKVQDFLTLLTASTGERNAPPLNHFIANATYEGFATGEATQFRCRFEITLLNGKLTCVKLFSENVALVRSSVSYRSEQTFPDLSAKDPFSIIKLEPEDQIDLGKLPVIQSIGQKVSVKGEDDAESVLTSAYCIGVYKNHYCLIASQPGTYVVNLKILVPYATARKTGFLVSVPRAVQNQITFKVPEKDILIKVDPCLFTSQQQVEEFEDVYFPVKDSQPKKVQKSVLKARFPPTDRLSVQWTENMGTNVRSEEKVEVSATAEQKSLVSIGEGILILYNSIFYKIVSGQMSLFEVEVDKRVKVISVESSNNIPIKRWEMITPDAKGKSEKSDNNNESEMNLLKVFLDYGVEQSFEFTVIGEMEMEGTSCKVTIPTFSCLTSKEITRDKGFIAVEARTNVEVAEMQTSAVDTIDVSEIPDALSCMAEHPLLFAYKYLVPHCKLELDVKKHADVGVLIAVVESALFSATYSEEGSVMYKIILRVKNTQKQYVRIAVPKEIEIWSTLIQGTAVKPAMDENGLLMIPLDKASKSESESTVTCTVEFIYIKKGDPMGKNGTLEMEFPSCDLPINTLFVSAYLPDDYKYGEFTGIQEVKWWTGSPPGSVTAPVSPTGGKRKVKKDRKEERRARQEVEYDEIYQTEQLMDMMPSKSYAKKAQNWSSHAKSVLPVKVEIPTTGTEFKFQELLVLDKPLEISARYKKKSKGCCGRKKKCCCCYC